MKKNISNATTTTTTTIVKRKRTTKLEKAQIDENKTKINHTSSKFSADINGKKCEGVMVKFDDRSIYLCQDFIVGGFINSKLRQGYKFSFFVGMGEITSNMVKNFKIID